MGKKLGILIVVAMVAAACGAETADQPTATSPATEVADDHHAGDTDVAPHDDTATDDHHAGDTDVAPHDDTATDEHHAGDTDVAPHDDTAAIVEVSVTEFSFDHDAFAVKAGETVSFVVTNSGRIDHEFRLTTEHAAHEHMEEHVSDHVDHMTAEGSHHEENFVMIAPGATETLTMTFHDDADFDVAGCLLPGHWEAGLFSPLTIES